MTGQPVPWLPVECLRGAPAAHHAGTLVDAWSRKWLARDRWQALGSWAEADADNDRPGWAPLREGPRATVHGAPKAMLRLALAILGESGKASFSRRDLAFLRRLAGQALDDLAENLEAALPASGPTGDSVAIGNWFLPLGPIGDPLLAIEASSASLVLLARQQYRRRALPSPHPRSAAWAGLTVPIAARLGTATIPLAQLDTLEPGDVIVLDRRAEAPMTLLVAGQDTPLACSLAHKDAGLALKLEPLP